MTQTLFEKIITKEIPGVFVYEDDICVVIMDKFPETEGKTLVISRKPIDYTFDLDQKTYTHCMNIAQKIAKASDKAFNTTRTCMIVEGFEVPHAHIKLYPVTTNELIISGGKEASDEDLQFAAKKIKAHL